MAYGVFDTFTMVETVEKIFPPKMFLLDTFFSMAEPSDTEFVTFDAWEDDRQLAPFVRYESQGKVADAPGFTNKVYTPPYIKQKTAITAKHLYNREMGQTIYQGTSSPAARVATIVGRRLGWLQRRVMRREEWMASQVLQSGVVAISGEGYDAEIDFGMRAAHVVTISVAGEKWTASTAEPLRNIEDYAELIAQNGGHVANICIMGTAAAQEFVRNSEVQTLLDNRRIIMGEIKPQNMPNGVQFLGTAIGIDFYKYVDFYRDSSGTLQRIWPTNKILLASTQALAKRHYGAIYNIKSGVNSVRWFPSSWETDDPSVRWLMLESAPVPALYEPDGFLTSQVMD